MADGSCFVTGWFDSSATFGAGETNETALSGLSKEIFVARYNPNGTLTWASSAGGGADDIGYGIAVTAATTRTDR